jgi:monofunctional biosynthetic peptidoglycan transglycosylase
LERRFATDYLFMGRRVTARRVSRWALGTCAWAFAAAGYTWITLPDIRPLKTTAPASTAYMQMRVEEARAGHKPVRQTQRWVGYDHISSALKRAVLVAEDDAFFQHDGLDYSEIRAALADTIEKGEALRGASTITQQLAKNLYLSPSRNPYRKLKELLLTRRLEAILTKRRILELYLNVVEWGDGIWGCEAAARVYFDVSAGEVNADQAALLAGSLSNPRVFNPADPSSRLRRQADLIRKRMGPV